jgi:hypothetical protein
MSTNGQLPACCKLPRWVSLILGDREAERLQDAPVVTSQDCESSHRRCRIERTSPVPHRIRFTKYNTSDRITLNRIEVISGK